MGQQIHHRFTNEHVQEMLARYVSGQVEGKHIRSVLPEMANGSLTSSGATHIHRPLEIA